MVMGVSLVVCVHQEFDFNDIVNSRDFKNRANLLLWD